VIIRKLLKKVAKRGKMKDTGQSPKYLNVGGQVMINPFYDGDIPFKEHREDKKNK
jgi:hypothetical protein